MEGCYGIAKVLSTLNSLTLQLLCSQSTWQESTQLSIWSDEINWQSSTSGSKTTIARTRQNKASWRDENLWTRLAKFGMSCTLKVSSLTASTSSASPTAATTTDDATTSKTLKQHSDTKKVTDIFLLWEFLRPADWFAGRKSAEHR